MCIVVIPLPTPVLPAPPYGVQAPSAGRQPAPYDGGAVDAEVEAMTVDPRLRPVERRMLRLADAGMLPAEIGRRFHRSAAHVQRTLTWAHLPGRRPQPDDSVLRPLERRLLRWRDQGVGLDELAGRFRRGRDHLARVLELADLKLEGLARPV
jgi:DNA-binding CsgD family transcriptional regulator